MQRFLLILIFSLFLFSACKKSNGPGEEIQPDPIDKVLIKPAGQPTGEAITKTIGTEGGTLTSADRLMVVSIPAGAVAANTAFSLQPVENALDTIHPAFRLRPAGVQFQKPITITFQYGNLNLQGNDPKMFKLFYQDESGKFFTPAGMTHNVNAKTFSVQTLHFSDWSITENYAIEYNTGAHRDANNIAHLKAGQHLKLLIGEAFETKEDTSVLMIPPLGASPAAQNADWKIIAGPGALLNIGDDRSEIMYVAPATLSGPVEVLISATLNGNFGKDNLGNPVKQLILLQTIMLDAEYFTVAADNGGSKGITDFGVTEIAGGLGIAATDNDKGVYTVLVYGNHVGTYAFGLPGTSGAAYIEYSIASGGFKTYRQKDCTGNISGLLISSGAVTISHVATQKGDYTTGEVGGAGLYRYDFCDPGTSGLKTFNMSAKFSIMKK